MTREQRRYWKREYIKCAIVWAGVFFLAIRFGG